MICHHFRSMSVVAMFLGVSGCMASERDLATSQEPLPVATTRLALQTTASAEPGENDGFFKSGAGALLSAIGDTAVLTVYVVTPAEIVTFERPTLRITSQQASAEMTEVSEQETVTLEAGESWSFSEEADGNLMHVSAEIDAVVL